jgi:hypothetical protein
MAREHTNHLANPDSASGSPVPSERWGRPLAIGTAIVFGISSAFPVVAAFVRDTESWPKWWGVLDVIIAFQLGILALAVLGLAQGKVNKPAEEASYRAYRVLMHGILALLVVFLLVGDRIVWSNCLTGFAWRAWLLLYVLPAWFTALRSAQDIPDLQAEPAVGPARGRD